MPKLTNSVWKGFDVKSLRGGDVDKLGKLSGFKMVLLNIAG